ncbi:MAG: hypothetical protein AAGH60_10150 [Pseudomonadota bacterium]
MSVDALLGSMIERLVARHPNVLSPLGAGIMAAVHTGYCKDSQSFAKKLEVEHALVIRECVLLADEYKAIHVDRKNDRNQRLSYSLTDVGRQMLAEAV